MRNAAGDLALLILRITAGLIFLPHGWPKVAGDGPAAFASDIAANYNIPAFLGYLAAYAEVVGAVLLIAGFLTRLDAFLLACTMFVAAFIVQLPDALFELQPGASKVFVALRGIEMPLALFAICFALVLTGGGRVSLDHLLKIEEKTASLLPRRKTAAGFVVLLMLFAAVPLFAADHTEVLIHRRARFPGHARTAESDRGCQRPVTKETRPACRSGIGYLRLDVSATLIRHSGIVDPAVSDRSVGDAALCGGSGS